LPCIPKFNSNVVIRSDILYHTQNLVGCASDPKSFFEFVGPNLLLYTAKHGNSHIVELLLEAGIDVESSDVNGRTSLHLAAAQQAVVVRTLLRANASVKSRDEWGRSPLHYAADNANIQIVSMLLSAGADVNASSVSNHTVLHYAVEKANVNASSISSHTVLHYAVENLHTTLVQLLLAAGADPNSTASWQLRTPLHIAGRVGHLEGAKALLAANADPNLRDRFGATPLHQAAEWGTCSIIDALVAGGADITMKDHGGLTPIEEALNRSRKGAAQTLFKYWLEFVPLENRVSYSIETMSFVEIKRQYWRLKDMLPVAKRVLLLENVW
jgi:ankyrin repeat protein